MWPGTELSAYIMVNKSELDFIIFLINFHIHGLTDYWARACIMLMSIGNSNNLEYFFLFFLFCLIMMSKLYYLNSVFFNWYYVNCILSNREGWASFVINLSSSPVSSFKNGGFEHFIFNDDFNDREKRVF